MDYREFEQNPSIQQLYIDFEITTEQLFETLKAENIDMTTTSYPNMVDSISIINFGNTFHHQNVPNKHHHTEKQAVYHNKSRH